MDILISKYSYIYLVLLFLGGNLGYFQVFIIINNTVMNINV